MHDELHIEAPSRAIAPGCRSIWLSPVPHSGVLVRATIFQRGCSCTL